MAMAKIGATAQGGCNRQALTDADWEGRALLASWAHAAGCATRVDSVGNLFVRRPGREDALPVVMTGSHLDTQPTGGKFDGVYGVIAGLEVVDSLNDLEIITEHPIEIVVWCNEEGCRFPQPMMGSAVWAGRTPLESAYALTDPAGKSVRQELERLGVPTGTPVLRQPVKAALEVHIEQGPVLERCRKTIGIVTGVQHMSRHEVIVEGQEAHAGPTPMDMRRDPIRVLAELLPAFYAAAQKRAPDARLTVGIIETSPGSPNTVPGRLRVIVDLRHPLVAEYRSLREEIDRLVAESLQRQGLKGSIRCVWEAPGVEFDARVHRGRAASGGGAAIERHGFGQRRRPRFGPRGRGGPDRDDLCPLRRWLEPQRSGERAAVRLGGRRERVAARHDGARRRGRMNGGTLLLRQNIRILCMLKCQE